MRRGVMPFRRSTVARFGHKLGLSPGRAARLIGGRRLGSGQRQLNNRTSHHATWTRAISKLRGDAINSAARGTPMWQVAVLLGAVAASVAALWVTLSADFLTYPGWLAVQKADFILGPVLAGLYWYRRRPRSRFGPMLIGFGFLGALYVFQSSSNSWLFSIGLLAEIAIGIATRVLILAFPTGRLDRPAMAVLAISILVSPLPSVLNLLVQ